MARVFRGSLALIAVAVAMTPVSAMEPLQRSRTDSVSLAPIALDLTSEQDYFGASSAQPEGVAQGPSTPAAPGEKGRVPHGHALVDLSF